MNWLEELVNNYYIWLKNKTNIILPNGSDWAVIDTPFIGQFNDAIELFAKKEEDRIILSDDGITLQNLQLSGVSLSRSNKRKELLDYILLNYGINLNNEELIVEANENNFPQKKQFEQNQQFLHTNHHFYE